MYKAIDFFPSSKNHHQQSAHFQLLRLRIFIMSGSKLLFYDGQAVNTMVVRLFILERGGLSLDAQTIDIMALENRKPAFRSINPRGELPALKIDDFVLTEITAICEYLDEIAQGGQSLFGETPLERAETRMWLRRMDLEIAQPVIEWYRNDPATIDFYKGHRLPTPEARVNQKVVINQFLNLLDDELEGKTFLCGERFSAADVHFFGLVDIMAKQVADWVIAPSRRNVAAYFKRMNERDASQKALAGPMNSHVSVPSK
jgi:glutathione S-transferase